MITLTFTTKALTKCEWSKMKRDARQKCRLFLRNRVGTWNHGLFPARISNYYYLQVRIRFVRQRSNPTLEQIKLLPIEDFEHGFHFQVKFSIPYLIQLKEFFSNQMSNLSCSTLKIIVRSSVTQTCGRPDNITTLRGADNFEASSLLFPIFYLAR